MTKNTTHIWVDADALPNAVKDIIFRAAERLRMNTTFVANQPMRLKKSAYIFFTLVRPGLDVADNHIIERVHKNDLVITADIPLAAAVVKKEAIVLSPRGDVMTEDNVRERLSIRDFMQDLRQAGIDTGGPASFSEKDKQNFANAFDKVTTQLVSLN